MDRDEVCQFVDRSQEIIDEAPQMGETSTKDMLIRPFIELLGWEMHPSEVKHEFSVRMATTQTKVDYALMLENTPAVFIEAKGLDTELSEDHKEQITSYMHNQEGVEWGLLTNGKEFTFFKYDGTTNSDSLATLNIEELPERIETVRTLSKTSIEEGESEKIADNIQRRRRAVRRLRSDKDEIADEITETVTERVGETVSSVVETEAKEFVDRVVEEVSNGGVRHEPDISEHPTEAQGERIEESAIVGHTSRGELRGNPDDTVAIFPTRESGIQFLKENNAWGFVRINSKPRYVGMYVTSPEMKIKYVAEVGEIIPADEADLARPLESYVDMAKFDPDKKVITFKEGSLYELEDPIEYDGYTPQSLIYTSLEKFKRAEGTNDLT